MLMLIPMQQRLAALAACAPRCECEPVGRRRIAGSLSAFISRRFFKFSILTKS